MSEHDHLPDAALAPESEFEATYEHEQAHEGDEGEPSGHEHAPTKKGSRFAFAQRGKLGFTKLKRETRFGIAALLSFLILVSVLLVNKGSKKGTKPPLPMAMAPPEASSSDSSSSKPESASAPDKAKPRVKKPDGPSEPKTEPGTPPAPMEPNSDSLVAEGTRPPRSDTNLQDAGNVEIRPVALESETTSPLPPPATQSALDGLDLGAGKEADKEFPLPADPSVAAATNESDKNIATAPEPAPAPAPAPAPGAESPSLPPSETEPPKPAQGGTSELAPPVGAEMPDGNAPPQAAAPPMPASEASAPPAQAAAPPKPASEASAPPAQAAAPPMPASDVSAPPAQAEVPSKQLADPGPGLPPPSTAPALGTDQAPATAKVAAPVPTDVGSAAVRPAVDVPNFAPSPASDEAVAVSAAPPEIKPGEGIPIPNAGKGRSLDEDLGTKLAPATAAVGASMAAAGSGAVAAKAEAEESGQDLLTSELHVVQSGENFWTISKYYYNSGRYYMALWKANSRTVSAADQLTVGQTIVIPPLEALDRREIVPPRKANAGSSSSSARTSSPIRKTSRSKPKEDDSTHPGAQSSSEVDLILPIDNSLITRRNRLQSNDELDPPPEKRYQASRPRYKVRHSSETLRSIARETLKDPRRSDEIFDLNRDILNDNPRPKLVEGQILVLPEDARLGRASR
ncbi:Nucleoid-associated protein YgaU, contains BON and LysM domains [Singulisphaera sp. GP187]|uniref:LysM peptidoglycan-binding domain-containing protein n=1 Tax=Singulisphaera sp. GP187 TaxID=1882752 RepID=UPI00092748C5|nr:LysM peptidoglycan-binding domain-containing protein [Singulisphaera sp. GP187]SIO59119.1 Nucleoid-associated protein YgaU, contains BON and LysM domains [Singulisphaera sp. GP187]